MVFAPMAFFLVVSIVGGLIWMGIHDQQIAEEKEILLTENNYIHMMKLADAREEDVINDLIIYFHERGESWHDSMNHAKQLLLGN